MPNVFDLSGEFYDKHQNLFDGMTVSADELYFLLANDITQAYHEKYRRRISITADLAGEALEQVLKVQSTAFKTGETAKRRQELLRSWLDEQIAELQSNPQAHGLNCSAEHLTTAYSKVRDTKRKLWEAAGKMSGSIPGLRQELLTLIRTTAEVIAADQAVGTNRTSNGLSANVEKLIDQAAGEEREALDAAFSGLTKASLFATAGADLATHKLASDDPAKAPRNLFRWEDPGALKRHYPETSEMDAAGLDSLTCQIASRINYPFGLMKASSRSYMLAAIFLTHSFLPNAKVAALAEGVVSAVGLTSGHEITEEDAANLALQATAKAYSVKKIKDFHGFDFVRVAGTAAVTALPAATPTGWPANLLETLLRGPQETAEPVRHAATAVSSALPLTEPGVPKPASWARTTRWETVGETAARIVCNDPAYRSASAAVRDEELDPSTMSTFGTDTLVSSQFDRLLQDFPMEQLLLFRNDLVNSETGNREEPCTFESLLALNGFLKEWTAKKLNDRLRELREARQELVLELRRAAERDAGRRHSEGYVEDLMPGRVIRELVAQNLIYADLLLEDADDPSRLDAVLNVVHGAAEQSGVSSLPLRSTGTAEKVLRGAISRNNRLLEDQAVPAPDADGPQPSRGLKVPWLGLLTSPAVRRQLAIFASADGTYTYTASLGSVQSSIEFSGPVLRDAACALEGFISWATKRRTLAKTLPDAIQTYLKGTRELPANVRHLHSGAATLAASLVLDSHKAANGQQHIADASTTGL